jgi:hypothetical protein
MDPFLGTELEDGLDFDAGQFALVLVTASWDQRLERCYPEAKRARSARKARWDNLSG